MADYTYIKSKTGETVPAINGMALHSTVDPVREAQKLLATIPDGTGFLIFLGLGGGFAPLEARKTGAEVIVIDYKIKDLLAADKYSSLKILQDPSGEEIKNYISANYKPALHGGIKVIPLRTRVDIDKELFENCVSSIQQAIESTSADYSVQAHFGKRWFCNIIRNIAFLREDTQTHTAGFFSGKINNAAIIAAGPSLDTQIDKLAEYKNNGTFIICSDTALGSLIYNGIKPDAVVSIDCQYKSYYHFLGHDIKDIQLVLDIASPAALSCLSETPVFFASGHPLANYFSDNGYTLPRLDTSGGNVTYACFSLARYLGAENISLFGADFAYIRSQSYARGTYVMPYFEERQNRFKPLEAQASVFMYRSPFLEAAPGQQYRETAQLKFYREMLEAKADACITPGCGKPLILTQRTPRRAEEGLNFNKTPRSSAYSAVEFLIDYRYKIENSCEQDVLTTILPYAAFLKHRNPKIKTKDLLNETKLCCINEINRITNSCQFV